MVGNGAVVDVRGFGLVVAVELPSFEVATAVVSSAEDAGLLLRQPGEVVMAVPPLTIDDVVLDAIADRLEHALSKELR